MFVINKVAYKLTYTDLVESYNKPELYFDEKTFDKEIMNYAVKQMWANTSFNNDPNMKNQLGESNLHYTILTCNDVSAPWNSISNKIFFCFLII